MSDQEEKNSSHNDDVGNEEPANRPDGNGENNENNENNNENEINNNGNENGNENDRFIKSREPFYYFEPTGGNCECFSLENITIGSSDDYKYCMCILMEDDSKESSQKLYYTLTGIKENLKSLEDNLEIIAQDICLFIFVKRTLNNILFDDSEKEILNEQNQNFIMKEKTIEEGSDLKNIKIYIISNFNGLYEIRALKCYYSILEKLIENKNMIFSSIITAGVIPVEDSLLSLIRIAYNKKNNHGISVAPIEYTPNNLYSKIALYEKIHFNIFNMSLYDRL